MQPVWKKGFLKEFLLSLKEVKHLQIATAYISNYGLEILIDVIEKNHLKKDQVEIYIGETFSTTDTISILEDLQMRCTTSIVTKETLHAKVYFATCQDGSHHLFTGSSNLTTGGSLRNLELNMESHVNVPTNQMAIFFSHCKNISTLVTPKIIDMYVERYEEFEQYAAEKERIELMLPRPLETDPFQSHTYDLHKHYFNFVDYETLFPRHQGQKNKELSHRRLNIREKLLVLDESISPYMEKWNLHHHWSKKNIVSSTEPNKHNLHRLNWMCVRYGKTENEVREIGGHTNSYQRYDEGSDAFEGFQKHACIQFGLISSGIAITLFHAVADNAVDRELLKQKLHEGDPLFLAALEVAIEILKENEFTWYVSGGFEHKTFGYYHFNELATLEGFLDFYHKHDQRGRQSYCSCYIDPDDDRLTSISSFRELFLEKVQVLLPLYNAITFRVNAKQL